MHACVRANRMLGPHTAFSGSEVCSSFGTTTVLHLDLPNFFTPALTPHTAATTPESTGGLQLPIAAAALGLYHTHPIPGMSVNLTACGLARAYSRQATLWGDLLPGAADGDKPIQLLGFADGHGAMETLAEYLSKVRQCGAGSMGVGGCEPGRGFADGHPAVDMLHEHRTKVWQCGGTWD
eukprot:354694-Chlamydomonas_euryale.AAC.1